MSKILLSPVTLRYTGLDADEHHIDAELFGKSIAGTAKLYNAATHMFYTGTVPSNRTKYKIKMHTNAEIKEGSVCAALWATMALGEMAMYPTLWGELADMFVPEWVKAVYAKLVHRDSEVKEIYDKCITIMQEERQKEREHVESITKMAFSTILDSQKNFMEVIESISSNSKAAAIASVEPIGRSTNAIEQQISRKIIIQLDQPIADSLRSKEELEVADPKIYTGRIVEANKHKKSCQIMLDGYEKPITARISDPVIENTGNIYTHALDQDLRVKIEAKATIKDEEIKMLYISHAEEDNS